MTLKILLLDMGKILRGGQRQVFYLAMNLMRTDGFEPLVALPAKAPLRPMLEQAGIPYAVLPSGSDLNPLNMISLLGITSRFQPDVVHTNDAKGASLGALLKKFRKNIRLVHSRRVSYALKAGWSKKKYLAGDKLVAVSGEIRDVLVNCGIPEEKTSVIHSGIDASRYTTEKHPHPMLTIGAVGALSSQKGFEVLIDALGVLKEDTTLPPWQCLIAGDGPLLVELKARADRLDLSRSILFLGHRDSREVLPEIDILTVPSVDGEGSNAVIKEGWASGTPVITSDLPSNLELVTHEHNGLVFKNRDPKELAESIIRVYRDPALATRMKDNGSISLEEYTDKIMTAKYIKIYQALSN
ncbi:glycosyltransferase family 4 protein [Pseudodesulfovibrio sp.]|uniref:glycosyltransferase family 4 protein n=1 Tax=unclassified Pseudodesulfovibrio TaxID=2661612 RepID=UPI003AFFDB99